MPDDGGNPAVQRRRLRAALRQARQEAELTQEQVATALDWSQSKIVRIENGSVRISTTDLMAMLAQYKITNPVRAAELVTMARVARQRPWWRSYKDFASQRYLEFVEFEQAAVRTMHVQPLFVPGILQTREYARAIIWKLGRDITEERAKGLLEFRIRRQELLDASKPPELSFVLDESAVRRWVGSSEVMMGQLGHLIELAERTNITIQVFPFSAGLAYGMQTPFVIHQFQDDPDVLYLEGPRGDTLVDDDEDEIARYRGAFKELQELALSGPESVKFLRELLGAYR